jgi:acyl carrier protein
VDQSKAKQVIECVTRIRGQKSDGLTGETCLFTDLQFESIDIVDLCFELEAIAGKQISLPQLYERAITGGNHCGARRLTINAIVAFLEEQKSGQSDA